MKHYLLICWMLFGKVVIAQDDLTAQINKVSEQSIDIFKLFKAPSKIRGLTINQNRF